MNKLNKNYNKTFEEIRHVGKNGFEFWYARELQKVLDYKEWRKFDIVINKAKNACANSLFEIEDHFVGADKMVEIGSGARREGLKYELL